MAVSHFGGRKFFNPMKKKITIFIIVIILLVIGGFITFRYLGGYPVGLQNGRLVIRQYFCSDVCPQYGGWHEEYFGVNKKEDCEQIGGRSIIDPAWGGFVGCAPK